MKQEQKNKCLVCGKKTKHMYSMNLGLYCEKHWQYGYLKQQQILSMEAFVERMKLWRTDNRPKPQVNF